MQHYFSYTTYAYMYKKTRNKIVSFQYIGIVNYCDEDAAGGFRSCLVVEMV